MFKKITWKGFFKKTGITILLFSLISFTGVTVFLYQNNAPITNGDVSYGIEYKPGMQLDLYAPTKKVYVKTPVIFYIHGGAWIGGHRESINLNRFNGAINELRESGYAIISPDYSIAMLGKSPFPDCIIDGLDAVEWAKVHADEYNFDLNNFGILGESAGAHIGMMMAFPDTALFSTLHKPTHFNYMVDVYGPTKMEGIYHSKLADSLDVILTELPGFISEKFNVANYLFGFDPKVDTVRAIEMMKTFSPYNYVKKNAPPMLIIHGDNDIVVPFEQSLLLSEKLCQNGVKTEFHRLENVNHGFIGASNRQKAATQVWITDFVKRNYRR